MLDQVTPAKTSGEFGRVLQGVISCESVVVDNLGRPPTTGGYTLTSNYLISFVLHSVEIEPGSGWPRCQRHSNLHAEGTKGWVMNETLSLIVAIGAAAAVVLSNWRMYALLRRDLTALRVDMSAGLSNIKERLARLEGQVDLLLQGLHIEIRGGGQ